VRNVTGTFGCYNFCSYSIEHPKSRFAQSRWYNSSLYPFHLHHHTQGHFISCCIYPVTCLLPFQRPSIHSLLCIPGFKVRIPLAKQKKRYLPPCRIFYDCDCDSQIASEVTTGFGSCFLQRVLGLARLHDYYYQCLCSFDDLAPNTLADPTSLPPC